MRQKVAQGAQRGAARDPEHEDGCGLSGWVQQGGGGDEIPCEACQETISVKGGMDRAGDAEFRGERGFPDGDFLETGFEISGLPHVPDG